MSLFKRGRRPAFHSLRTMKSALALAPLLDALGTAPAKCNDYTAAVKKQAPLGWGVFLNDRLGDCVCADSCHQVMLHTANAGTIVIPTDDQCEALYEAVGGYVPGNPSTDQGCDEAAMCQYMQTTGIAGQKSAGSGAVDPTNIEHIKWSILIFGALRTGIVVDQQMEEQFSNNQPWTTAANPNDPDAGGHDVPFVDYDSEYAYAVTWGGLQPIAWPLVLNPNFMDECHAEAYPDWIRAGGTAPSGFDLQGLLAKLQQVEVSSQQAEARSRAVWSLGLSVTQSVPGVPGSTQIGAEVSVTL